MKDKLADFCVDEVIQKCFLGFVFFMTQFRSKTYKQSVEEKTHFFLFVERAQIQLGGRGLTKTWHAAGERFKTA